MFGGIYWNILSDGDFLGLQLITFIYVALAAKATNLEDPKHSESAFDL